MAVLLSQMVDNLADNFSTHVFASNFQLVDDIGPQVDGLCGLGLHPPCEHPEETRWLLVDFQLQLDCNVPTCRPVAAGHLQVFELAKLEAPGIPVGDVIGHDFRQLVTVPLRAPGHGKCENADVKVEQCPLRSLRTFNAGVVGDRAAEPQPQVLPGIHRQELPALENGRRDVRRLWHKTHDPWLRRLVSLLVLSILAGLAGHWWPKAATENMLQAA